MSPPPISYLSRSRQLIRLPGLWLLDLDAQALAVDRHAVHAIDGVLLVAPVHMIPHHIHHTHTEIQET